MGIIYEFKRLDGLNWFVYCGNNPLTRVDPTGLAEEDPDNDFDKFANLMDSAHVKAKERSSKQKDVDKSSIKNQRLKKEVDTLNKQISKTDDLLDKDRMNKNVSALEQEKNQNNTIIDSLTNEIIALTTELDDIVNQAKSLDNVIFTNKNGGGIKQTHLDLLMGFDSTHSVTCNTASMINNYANNGGISLESVISAMDFGIKNGNLDLVLDIQLKKNEFSMALAHFSGRKKSIKYAATYTDYNKRFGYGILMQELNGNTHFVGANNNKFLFWGGLKKIDSLNPAGWWATNYKPDSVQIGRLAKITPENRAMVQGIMGE